MAERTRLPILCPQDYRGCGEMVVAPCTRCTSGWDRSAMRCTITTGAEGMPTMAAPPCPIAERCQHARQAAPELCEVQRSGQVCESALRFAGWTEDQIDGCDFAFNADYL